MTDWYAAPEADSGNTNPIIDAIERSTSERYQQLEQLYRQQPDEFKPWLDEALTRSPSSDVLLTWQARLAWHASQEEPAKPAINTAAAIETTAASETTAATETTVDGESQEPWRQRASWQWVVVLGLIATVLAKLPTLFAIDEDWYYPRFIAFLPVLPMLAYGLMFPVLDGLLLPSRLFLLRFGAVLMVLIGYLALMPDTESDSTVMALIHVGPLMMAILTFSLMQQRWRETTARLAVLRLLGETLLLSVLVLLGGMVMTGLTLGLFSTIGLDISSWYMEYVVIGGLVSAPMVGLYVFDHFLDRRARLAAMLSRIFAPLFLITAMAYLIAMLAQGTNPYTDRDFLILMNGILLVIWGITVFSIVGRQERQFNASDGINLALIVATLIIDLIALFAISLRWWDQGITPNRVAVTGANLVIFVHLTLMLREYLKLAKNNGSQSALEHALARYLPVYSVWAAFVVVLLPLLFHFQ